MLWRVPDRSIFQKNRLRIGVCRPNRRATGWKKAPRQRNRARHNSAIDAAAQKAAQHRAELVIAVAASRRQIAGRGIMLGTNDAETAGGLRDAMSGPRRQDGGDREHIGADERRSQAKLSLPAKHGHGGEQAALLRMLVLSHPMRKGAMYHRDRFGATVGVPSQSCLGDRGRLP